MGSSYKLWEKRLRTSETLTRGQITQFCNAVAAGAYGFMIGGHHTNLTSHECALLMDVFAEKTNGYALTPEHTRFGIQWLRSDPKRAEECGIGQRVLDTFLEFRFVDVKVDRISDWGPRATILPVYRVISDAPWVDYSWSPWQKSAYA